jgi:hypothetical protein
MPAPKNIDPIVSEIGNQRAQKHIENALRELTEAMRLDCNRRPIYRVYQSLRSIYDWPQPKVQPTNPPTNPKR